MMRICWAAIVLVLAFAGCGGGDDEAGAPAKRIEVRLTDFALDPASVAVEEPGTYTFVAKNEGDAEHALEVEGHGLEEETDSLGSGEAAELTVELSAPGEYELYCPVGNHEELGMRGTLTVGETGGGETETGEADTDDDGGGLGY